MILVERLQMFALQLFNLLGGEAACEDIDLSHSHDPAASLISSTQPSSTSTTSSAPGNPLLARSRCPFFHILSFVASLYPPPTNPCTMSRPATRFFPTISLFLSFHSVFGHRFRSIGRASEGEFQDPFRLL